jgi:hypothetical protein
MDINNQLSIIDSVDVQSISTTLQKINTMQAMIQVSLKKDHDFGVIQGTNKPTLYKPGAEKILMMFGLTSEYEFLDKIEDFDKGFFSYSIKCILTKNGQKITEGVGHCNTYEGKYRWRWVKEYEIPSNISKDDLISKNDKYGRTIFKIENDDPFTLANTVLKMAKKRAQIDATLTVGSLSEVFTQDIEDMKDFLQNEEIETMLPEEAAAIKITFGNKHKGKTLGEIYKTDKGYFEWLHNNEKTDPVIKKGCEILINAANTSKANKDKEAKADAE